MRILAVEDHADTLDLIRRVLAKRGHEVTTASTLAEARHQCEVGGFDLVICDIGLPDGDGWELGKLAKKCGINAIALTGYGMKSDIAIGIESGFCAHLVKPVRFEALDKAVEKCT